MYEEPLMPSKYTCTLIGGACISWESPSQSANATINNIMVTNPNAIQLAPLSILNTGEQG